MTVTKAIGGRFRFARALRSRPFALLWLGQTISTLGDGAYLTALAWQVLILTGSGAAMGIVLIATSVPRVVFLLLGGVIADRLPRRLVMLWADAGRALAVGALGQQKHDEQDQRKELLRRSKRGQPAWHSVLPLQESTTLLHAQPHNRRKVGCGCDDCR